MLLPVDVRREVVAVDRGPPPTLLPPYPKGTKLEFHFKTEVALSGDLIDDSRSKPQSQSPMTLIIGKEFKLEIWEQLLQTMTPGQIIKATVPKHHVTTYPLVSKAIRDLNSGVKQSHHSCCGMMAQGLGYCDLDKLMDEPKDLVFHLHLLSASPPDSYEKEGWELTEEEKRASIPLLQSEGNTLFAKGDLRGAEGKYFEAVARVEQLLLKEHPKSEEHEALEALKAPILLNYAFCLMKREEYYEAISHIDTVIKIQPENVKAIFRRGKCHKAVGNWKEAKDDFGQVGRLDDTLKPTLVQLEAEMVEEEKKRDEKDKEKFKKIFQ